MLNHLFRRVPPVPEPPVPVIPRRVQGYLDARSAHHVAGWMRDPDDAGTRLSFEVVLHGDAGPEVLHHGVADRFSPVLVQVGVGDGIYGFHAMFPRALTEAEQLRVAVVPVDTGVALEHAPALDTRFQPWGADRGSYQGYLDERSTHHLAGWVRNLVAPDEKVAFEVVRHGTDGEHVLAQGVADQFSRVLVEIGAGDGWNAFQVLLDKPVSEAERDLIFVRPRGREAALELAPALRTEWWPIAHVAVDIVNNCNLRCPFCVVDYADVRHTKFMTEATFDAALRLLPFVSDGNFWLSCLHEATLHPKLLDFIARVPRQYRRKLFYTTNLAKRMPARYFSEVAESGMHHLNISVESFDPPVYEKMRKGARYRIFLENWEALLQACAKGSAPPRLRYNLMAYRSNLRSIPALVQTLLDDKQAWQVEIRHTYDVGHIPDQFREEEFLTTAEWAWLKDALAHHDPAKVLLLMPLGEQGYDRASYVRPLTQAENEEAQFSVPPAPWNRAPRPFQLSMNWEGTFRVYGLTPTQPGQPAKYVCYVKTNIHALPDPLRFLLAL